MADYWPFFPSEWGESGRGVFNREPNAPYAPYPVPLVLSLPHCPTFQGQDINVTKILIYCYIYSHEIYHFDVSLHDKGPVKTFTARIFAEEKDILCITIL